MTMDVKGQITVEYLLFIGFILVFILIIVNVVSDQSEQNSVATATRLGAVCATTDIVVSSNNIPIRVGELTTNGSNPINIIINLSSAVTNAQKTQIIDTVNRSLAAQGFKPNYNNNVLTLNTSRHNYNITISP